MVADRQALGWGAGYRETCRGDDAPTPKRLSATPEDRLARVGWVKRCSIIDSVMAIPGCQSRSPHLAIASLRVDELG